MSLRTEYSKSYDNGDGTITAFVDTVPIHYDDDGEWIDIDNSLILDEDGNYTNKSNSMNVTLASDTFVNDDNMVSIEYNGYSLSWGIVDELETIDFSRVTNINSLDSNVSVIRINNEFEKDNDFDISLDNKKLKDSVYQSISNLTSSAIYTSFEKDIDIKIDILPQMVKDTIYINDVEAIKDNISYYISAKDLTPVMEPDNTIVFYNDNDTAVFIIPAAYMFDSAEESESNYDIDVDISPCENGYILSLFPNIDWLLSDERVYPIMIDPVVKVSSFNGLMYYIKEANPNVQSSIYNSTVKIGGSEGDRYEAVLESPELFTNINNMSVITNAKFYLGLSSHTYMGLFNLYSLNSDDLFFDWNFCGGANGDTTFVDDRSISVAYFAYYDFDITKLVQTWYNYYKTNGCVGLCNFGFKIALDDSYVQYNRIFTAYSLTGVEPPYFEITYKTDSNYTLTYSSEKYNAYNDSVYNFQHRMNCYAYALQVYYSGELEEDDAYFLKPGEFGILSPLGNEVYQVDSYSDLSSITQSFTTSIKNDPVYPNKYLPDYMNFVEEQMYRDANALNYYIEMFQEADLFYNDDFTLPNQYNENDERIVAMIVYYAKLSQTVDYHYYMRMGNGTCPNGHGGNCSAWSHKRDSREVTNLSSGYNQPLCDQNITTYADILAEGANTRNYSMGNTIRFYTITKDTNVYNSWHGAHSDSNSTPYQQ